MLLIARTHNQLPCMTNIVRRQLTCPVGVNNVTIQRVKKT